MNKLQKTTLVLSMVTANSLFGMVGTTMIGNDTTTSAMAGGGVAFKSEKNMGLINPALVSGNYFSVGIKDVMPSVKSNGYGDDDFMSSQKDKTFVPTVALVHDMIPGVASIGFIAVGLGDAGVDYKKDKLHFINGEYVVEKGTSQITSSLKLAKFLVPIKIEIIIVLPF